MVQPGGLRLKERTRQIRWNFRRDSCGRRSPLPFSTAPLTRVAKRAEASAISQDARSGRQRSSSLPARQSHAAKDERKGEDVKHLQWLAEQADCQQRPK